MWLILLVWVQFRACFVEGVLLVVAKHLQQHGVVLEVMDEGGGHPDTKLGAERGRERREGWRDRGRREEDRKGGMEAGESRGRGEKRQGREEVGERRGRGEKRQGRGKRQEGSAKIIYMGVAYILHVIESQCQVLILILERLRRKGLAITREKPGRQKYTQQCRHN
jgi:hypothetical protein